MNKEERMATYGVAEITQVEGTPELRSRGNVDLDYLSQQLTEIRDAITPVLAEEPQPERFGLQSVQMALTVGAEGKSWFIINGSAEASITSTFPGPAPDEHAFSLRDGGYVDR